MKPLLPGVAEEVLQLETLDPATQSLKNLCKPEFAHLSRTGAFERSPQSPHGRLLWSVVMARFYYAETQAIEGLNSIVKLLGRRCPSITLELLSSRLAIKRLLGQADGVTGCRKKWSTVKALAEREVAELTQYATQALPVLADASRWSKAAPVPLAVQQSARQRALQCNTMPNHGNAIDAPAHASAKTASPETVTWAKSYNLGWKWRTGGGKQKSKKSLASNVKQQHSQCGFGVAILPTPDMQDTAFYLTADYFSHSVSFTRLRRCKQRVEVDGAMHVHDCLQWGHDRSSFADTVESTLLFAQYFETCHGAAAQKVPVHACFLDPSSCHQLFMNPGWLQVDDVMTKSVLLFEVTSSLMKGVSAPKARKVTREAKPGPEPELPGHIAPLPAGHACEGASAAESEHDQDHEHDYMHGEHASSELHDTSGSEVDDCGEGVGDDDGANAASAEKETQELKAFVNTAAGVPSRREIAHVTDEVAQAGCIAPVPEMQEEALLLLVRQRNALKRHQRSSQTQPVLDGVGDVYDCPVPSVAVCSDDSDSDDIKHASADDCEFSFLEQSQAGDAATDANLRTLHSWATGCVTMLKALQAVRALQSGTVPGSNKSISLVSMKPAKVTGCNCIRCKWGSDVDMVSVRCLCGSGSGTRSSGLMQP